MNDISDPSSIIFHRSSFIVHCSCDVFEYAHLRTFRDPSASSRLGDRAHFGGWRRVGGFRLASPGCFCKNEVACATSAGVADDQYLNAQFSADQVFVVTMYGTACTPDGTGMHVQAMFSLLFGSFGFVDGLQLTPRHQAHV